MGDNDSPAIECGAQTAKSAAGERMERGRRIAADKKQLINRIVTSVELACHEPHRPGSIDPVYVAISPHRIANEIASMLVLHGYVSFDETSTTTKAR